MAIKKILIGTDASNYIIGSAADDTIYGHAGNDVLDGGSGDDIFYGGLGDDVVYGGDGVDILFGEDGNDLLFGGTGKDTIYGGIGNDKIDGGTGVNYLNGAAGIDTLSYASMASSASIDGVSVYLYAGLGGATGQAPDTILNFENVIGTKFSDLIMGSSGNNAIYGGDERDFLYGLGGNDTLFGGSSGDWLYGGDGDDVLHPGTGGSNSILGGTGYDIADYSELKTSITIALAADTTLGGAERVQGSGVVVGDRYWSIEKIVGTAFDDSFENVGTDVDGGGGADHIICKGIDPLTGKGISADGLKIDGGKGSDTIEAAGNGQHIIGGDGLDWLIGGTFELGASTGVQTFQLQYAKGFDNIWYFGAEDRVEVSKAEFGIKPTDVVDFAYTQFSNVQGPVATLATPTFMYVADIGMLFFDRDGSGKGYAPVAIAHLDDAFNTANYASFIDFIA